MWKIESDAILLDTQKLSPTEQQLRWEFRIDAPSYIYLRAITKFMKFGNREEYSIYFYQKYIDRLFTLLNNPSWPHQKYTAKEIQRTLTWLQEIMSTKRGACKSAILTSSLMERMNSPHFPPQFTKKAKDLAFNYLLEFLESEKLEHTLPIECMPAICKYASRQSSRNIERVQKIFQKITSSALARSGSIPDSDLGALWIYWAKFEIEFCQFHTAVSRYETALALPQVRMLSTVSQQPIISALKISFNNGLIINMKIFLFPLSFVNTLNCGKNILNFRYRGIKSVMLGYYFVKHFVTFQNHQQK